MWQTVRGLLVIYFLTVLFTIDAYSLNGLFRVEVQYRDSTCLPENIAVADTMKRDRRGFLIYNREWLPLSYSYTFKDTMFYNPAFLPVVFDGRILPENLDFRTTQEGYPKITYNLVSPERTFLPLIAKNRNIRKQRRSYYMNPENYSSMRYSENMLSEISPAPDEEAATSRNFFKELVSTEDPKKIITPPEIKKLETEKLYWIIKGEHSLQVSQNHISDNWYQGGNSSFMLRNYHKFNIDYKKEKISFNNTIEWKLGLQNTSGDTVRKVSVNEDLFRTYSVFGYQAYNNWSYSASLEMKTPLFNAYPENSTDRKSSFLSPFDLNVGIGMSYSLEKTYENNAAKTIKFSTNIAPLSYDLRYIRSKEVEETNLGLEKGRKTRIDYGSLVNANLEYNFNDYISWTSRIKYFTNYERVEAEFENRLRMSLNRYFSTNIGVHLRFDDSTEKDSKLKYFQLNEVLSFGLNYKW